MTKLNYLFAAIFFLTTFFAGRAQSYTAHYKTPEGDTSLQHKLSLQKIFSSQTEASLYMVQLPSLLKAKGFITASVDSVQYDSVSVTAVVYLGEQYKWARISTLEEDIPLLESIHWPDQFEGAIDFTTLRSWQKKILDYLEENGRPFGKVY